MGRLLWVFLIGVLPLSCSSQHSPADTVATASGLACRIDAKRVCQEIRDKTVNVNSGELRMPPSMREQNAARTAMETVPFTLPNGSMVEIHCEINTEHSNVIYASVERGAPLSEADMRFLQGGGYCLGD